MMESENLNKLADEALAELFTALTRSVKSDSYEYVDVYSKAIQRILAGGRA